jgi:hypothetical protein
LATRDKEHRRAPQVPDQPIDDLVLGTAAFSNLMPCSRSTLSEPNSVSLHALSQQFIIPEAKRKL